MSLNDVMQRLKNDAARPSPVPDDINLDHNLWTLCRKLWTIQKTLKCSRCTQALNGLCKRGDARKAARANDFPCFHPCDKQLQLTLEIIKTIKAAI